MPVKSGTQRNIAAEYSTTSEVPRHGFFVLWNKNDNKCLTPEVKIAKLNGNAFSQGSCEEKTINLKAAMKFFFFSNPWNPFLILSNTSKPYLEKL